MASVLNGLRGLKYRELTHVLAMPDDEYAAYLAEVQSLKPKKPTLWKRQNVKTDGSTQTVRYDEQGFYTRWLNQRVDMKSVSMIAELEREQRSRGPLHGFGCQSIAYEAPTMYHSDMDRMQVQTHTGNHNLRNHPIHVPTNPGESVRG